MLLVAKLQNHLIYSRMGNSWLAAVGWGIQDYPKMLGANASIYLTRIDSHSAGKKIFCYVLMYIETTVATAHTVHQAEEVCSVLF